MKAIQHYEAGELSQAVSAALEEVKSAPTNIEKRIFLCQMLSFSGDLERADKQLDILTTQAPEVALGLSEFRQLIRGELARKEFYQSGRLPEFLGEPTEVQRLQLQASIALREQDFSQALELLTQAMELSPELSGTCNGQPFEGLRDLDDLLGTTLEVLTSNGKYYWIPLERVRDLALHPQETYHHLLWRRAEISVEDGPEGIVFLPAVYAHAQLDDDERAKLGRVTDWKELPSGPTLGIGQKTWLVGDEALPLMQLESMTITMPASAE